MKKINWEFSRGNSQIPDTIAKVRIDQLDIDPAVLELVPQLKEIVAQILMGGKLVDVDMFPFIVKLNQALYDHFAAMPTPQYTPLSAYLDTYMLAELWVAAVIKQHSGMRLLKLYKAKQRLATNWDNYVNSITNIYADLHKLPFVVKQFV